MGGGGADGMAIHAGHVTPGGYAHAHAAHAHALQQHAVRDG